MSYQQKLDALQLARTLTGTTNMRELIEAAQALECYLGLKDATPLLSQFPEFIKICKIQNPFSGTIAFEPWPYQTDLAYWLSGDHPKMLINAARQMGTTTMLSLYALHLAISKPDQTILLLANQFVQAVEILDRIKFAYEELAGNARPGVTVYNKGQLQFDNGSRILSRAASGDSPRGLSVDLAIIDNAAFISHSKQEALMDALTPALKQGSKIILASCPSDKEGFFADLWKNGSTWSKYALPWQVHPDRDENWEKATRLVMGDRFDQEYGIQFVNRESATWR